CFSTPAPGRTRARRTARRRCISRRCRRPSLLSTATSRPSATPTKSSTCCANTAPANKRLHTSGPGDSRASEGPIMFRPIASTLLAAAVIVSSACSTGNRTASPHDAGVGPVPLYEGLGSNGRKITTSSREAQRYFDQGLSFLFAFNHDEAIRSFRKAAELDPHAAMAWWGIAIASGPHINFPMMLPESTVVAWDALGRAQKEAAAGGADAVERELIDALAARYTKPSPAGAQAASAADRAPLDLAYANAMRGVWQRHPRDADVGALFAEAMMDLRPWNQWTPEGKAQPGTEEVLGTLDAVMKLRADHPLALHLYIHATEASRDPGRADVAANRLRDLQPGLGHLVHMPSHIDVRRGRWRDAVT